MGAERADFGYLGWIGHSNLGDDAIAEVLIERLAPRSVVPIDAGLRNAWAARRNGRAGLQPGRVLLGGGTVIGRANWRLQVEVALRMCGDHRAVMIGAGVEDPAFRGRRSFSSFGELGRWRRLLLERFDDVTVRGPRSAELCAEIGVEATVVGDPALLAEMTAVPREGGPIVVCLGYGDALRGGDQSAVVRTVAAALRAVPGREVVAVSVNPSDRRWAQMLAAELGSRVRCEDAFDLRAFDAAIDGAGSLIAERLHAGILGAAAGFAPVMLSYQPKVDDFAASVGVASHSTDALRISDLVDGIASSGHSPTTAASVSVLRSRLAAKVDELRLLTASGPLA